LSDQPGIGQIFRETGPINLAMTVPSCLLKIVIKDTPKLIWRRFVVPADLRLDRLHDIAQTVMGWQRAKPHVFEIRKQKFAPTGSEEKNTLPETDYSLTDFVSRSGTRLKYRYGDWVHDITVEKIRYAHPAWPFPIYCLEGVRRCPPEACCDRTEFTEYLKTSNYPDFDLVSVNKIFGVAGPVPLPEPLPKKSKTTKQRLDPFQRLALIFNAVSETT
jgi:hypothetical protein